MKSKNEYFYGEHLLKLPENSLKDVCIVESEKSANVASLFMPEYIWIACGGANMITESKVNILKNRNVTLVPDLDKEGREQFKKAANKYGFKYYDIAPEINDGSEIADYLIKEQPPQQEDMDNAPNEGGKTAF